MRKLLVVFLILVVAAVAAAGLGIYLAGRSQPLTGPTVLTLRLRDPLLDNAPPEVFPLTAYSQRESIASIYRALARARDDAGVEGLAVYIQDTRFGLAKAQELRELFTSLREAGKFVECYLEGAGEGSNGTLAYYLTTACDHVSLAPASDLALIGLYADSFFLKGTMEKLKVDPAFTHVGEFKSAGEIFTEYEHTPAAERVVNDILDAYYDQVVQAIAAARKLEPGEVRRLIDDAPYFADEALALGLVDALLYPDELRDRIEERVGSEPRFVPVADYAPGSGLGGQRLAVVFAQGTIVRGTGGIEPWSEQLFLGSDETAELLRELAEDRGVAAVVLRIDSPGGSALASDLILRAVELLAAEKPVIVSMSDVAASGGYYIACKAGKIVAHAATLTGSIGVVGGKFVTRRMQEEHLGISHDTVKRGLNADLYSSTHSFTPEQEATFRSLMERVYDTFVAHVAAGRGMSAGRVRALAEGRVWTGSRAAELGLVDEVGGLDRAVQLAREAAGIDPDAKVRLDFYPRPASFFELLFGEREPALPSAVKALLSRLAPAPVRLLELSPRFAELSRPF